MIRVASSWSLLKNRSSTMHDELHRRVVVVEEQHAVHARPLGLRLGARDDGAAGSLAAALALVLVVVGKPGARPARTPIPVRSVPVRQPRHGPWHIHVGALHGPAENHAANRCPAKRRNSPSRREVEAGERRPDPAARPGASPRRSLQNLAGLSQTGRNFLNGISKSCWQCAEIRGNGTRRYVATPLPARDDRVSRPPLPARCTRFSPTVAATRPSFSRWR